MALYFFILKSPYHYWSNLLRWFVALDKYARESPGLLRGIEPHYRHSKLSNNSLNHSFPFRVKYKQAINSEKRNCKPNNCYNSQKYIFSVIKVESSRKYHKNENLRLYSCISLDLAIRLHDRWEWKILRRKKMLFDHSCLKHILWILSR